MAKPRESQSPPLYAVTLPGLEAVAEEEIAVDLGGEVKKTSPGLVVFRLPRIDRSVLSLRTTEDVFLLGWGTDKLTYRAADLDSTPGLDEMHRYIDRFSIEAAADAWSELADDHGCSLT